LLLQRGFVRETLLGFAQALTGREHDQPATARLIASQ
jgi:hypothetical protein